MFSRKCVATFGGVLALVFTGTAASAGPATVAGDGVRSSSFDSQSVGEPRSVAPAADVPVLLQATAHDNSLTTDAGNPRYGFFKGDKEFTLSGAGNASNDFDTNTFGASASLGYFIEDNFEIAGRFNGTFASPSNSSYQIGLAAALDYHFRLMDGRLNPFVGANVGYNFGDNSIDSFAAGPEVGVKYLVNDTTFLYGMATYQWSFRDGDADAFDEGKFGYAIGIGFKF